MGYSVPAGIGISVGLNGKRIACVTGDGSFQLNIQELQTIKHYNLPVKIFIINNDGYLSIRFTQSRFFNKRFIGVDSKSGVSFPNSEKIARAYGIKFIRASKNSQLNKALDETLKYKGPVICEIVSPKDQEIIPTIASQKKPDGTMVSKPIEDMYPFLDRDEFNKNMFIKPIKE